MKRKLFLTRIEQGQTPLKASFNTSKADEMRLYRLKKRCQSIIEMQYSFFVTFTIAPDYYHLKKDTIRKKAQSALGHARYVLNEDYGTLNERLHFHALVGYDATINFKDIIAQYPYGAVNFKVVRVSKHTSKKISLYITKTYNHAIKATAGKVYYDKLKHRKSERD